MVVKLASTATAASLPSTATVAAGHTSGTFTVTAARVTASAAATITATNNGLGKMTVLTVNPAGAHPKVPQNGSASFRSSGTERPASGWSWDILLGSATVASSYQNKGWAVSYDTGSPCFTVGAPATAAATTGYKVRYVSGTLVRSALFDVTAPIIGVASNPPLPWAEDVRPTDSAEGGDFGPSAADSVDLATGAEQNDPGPDLEVRNPVGPDPVFSRLYRSGLAIQGYGSPGLCPGWVDNYDVTIQASGSSGWGALVLTYPNGSEETLTPTLNSFGAPTGVLTPPTGTPQLVSGAPSTTAGRWSSIKITHDDESTWTFTPSAANPNVYLLTRISNLIGRSILVSYDSIDRLRGVSDDRGNALLTCGYNGSYVQYVRDIYGRQVNFTFGSSAGAPALTSVSQTTTIGGTAPPRWIYGYTAVSGQALLTSTSVPDPRGGGGTTSDRIAYDPGTLRATSITNARGTVHSYGFQNGQTQVQSVGPGDPPFTVTQLFDSAQRSVGTVDAAGAVTGAGFADPTNPSVQTRGTNPLGQTVTAQLVPNYGQPLQTTEPTASGNVLLSTFGYDSSLFAMGRLTQAQSSGKTATSFTYYPNGLLHTVSTPKPGTSGTGDTVTTTYTYTPVGNVATITVPAPNQTAGSTVTYTYYYVSDPITSYIKPGGEGLGEPVAVQIPVTATTYIWVHYQYDDGMGNMTAFKDGLLNETDYLYNKEHQLQKVTYPTTGTSGSFQAYTTYTYRLVGRPLQSVALCDASGSGAPTRLQRIRGNSFVGRMMQLYLDSGIRVDLEEDASGDLYSLAVYPLVVFG